VSIQGGDNQSVKAGDVVATRPSVKVVDANNRAVPNVAVTFAVASGGGTVTDATPSTDANGVATVGSWTLGFAAGPNTLRATLAAAGVTGNPVTFTATALANVYQPAANASLSGTQNFTSVTIPAGVTVTVTNDLVLNVTGPVTIAGSLTGDCVGVAVNADGLLALNGQVSNACAGTIPAAGAPGVQLVGKGGYSVDQGNIVSSGPVELTNDPTLKDSDFGAPAATAPRLQAAAGLPPCAMLRGSFAASPQAQPAGAAGTGLGADGNPGVRWGISCRGDMTFTGTFFMFGQSGGAGGGATDIRANASAVGGDGGDGGPYLIRATGDIMFTSSSSTTITSGAGGAGGDAAATSTTDAFAAGGTGGSPGIIDIRAAGLMYILGPITLNMGTAGAGGDAVAIAGPGRDGAIACPAQVGGNVLVFGGRGGSTPNLQLVSRNTSLALVTVTGGNAGHGGAATGRAGKGGDGAQGCPDGAQGGGVTVNGRPGGDALLKDRTGAVFALGGVGGSVTFQGGRGGNGWNGCVAGNLQNGGAGGVGGTAQGNSGLGGTGLTAPVAGLITLDGVGNGGTGGDGVVAGSGGLITASGIGHNSLPTTMQPSFIPGTKGNVCAGAPHIAVNPLFGSVLEVTTTQANLAKVPVSLNIVRQNFSGPVTITQSNPDPGITTDFTSPTVVPDVTNSVAVTFTIQNASMGDHTVTFTATATVNGNLVQGQGTFTIHIPGTDPNVVRYAVTITKDPAVPGTDANNVESLTKMGQVAEVALLAEMVGSTPRIRVWGLMVNHVPVTLVNSGSGAGNLNNYSASALTLVPVPSCVDQPAAISITGSSSVASINFQIRILPTVSSTCPVGHPFGHVDYAGTGSRKP
jgi:hypothetical protein